MLSQSMVSFRRKNYSIVLPFGLLLILLLLSGCAGVNIANMIPDPLEKNIQFPVSVSLTVERGQRNGVEWYSGTIKPEEFKKAIIESLNKAGLFKDLASKDTADYDLVVKLLYAGSHPGFNMNAWVNAQWTLINKKTGEKIWDKLIEGKGHATVSDAFVGAKRQIMALEIGAKDNINEAINELKKLKL
jgi:hypothetical protein